MVTCQDLPRSGQPATGGSLRAFGLGEALKNRGHEVFYSVPKTCLTDETSRDSERWNLSHSVTDILNVLQRVGPDVVLFGNWGLANEAHECDIPTAIDINGSLILENFFRARNNFFDDATAKIRALTHADLIIAGSKQQKAYLTAWCLMAGLVPTDLPIAVVPFSLPPDLPAPQPPESPVFVMAGYNWPWLNGQKTFETISRELEEHQIGRFNVFAGPPPYSDVFPWENSESDRISEFRSSPSSRVTVHDPLPFEHLVDCLRKSTVAVDLWDQNIEREISFSTRAATYLWTGLPVITSPYGGLAPLIDKYKAGWLVEPDNRQKLKALVKKIIMQPKSLNRYRRNAQRLARDCLDWDKTIDPLDRFCRSPGHHRRCSPFLGRLESADRTILTQKQDIVFFEQVLEQQRMRIAKRNQRVWAQNHTIAKMKKEIENINADRILMGHVHRRPKGLAYIFSPGLGWQMMRRAVVGVPVLFYLYLLTSYGQLLERLWNWWRRT